MAVRYIPCGGTGRHTAIEVQVEKRLAALVERYRYAPFPLAPPSTSPIMSFSISISRTDKYKKTYFSKCRAVEDFAEFAARQVFYILCASKTVEGFYGPNSSWPNSVTRVRVEQ